MRRLVFGLAALALLLVVIAAIALVFLNRIISANRDVILGRAQEAVGRRVDAREITVRLSEGLGIGLSEIEIGEDPAFGDEPFVRAQELSARLRLLPLLERRLEIVRVTLKAPTIRAVRAASGRWNYESLGSAQRRSGKSAAASSSGLMKVSEPRGGALASLAFLVDSARVVNGTLILVDRTKKPASTTSLRRIDLRLRDISLDRPISFELTAAVDADEENVQLTGIVGPLKKKEALPVTMKGEVGPFTGVKAVVRDLDIEAVASRVSLKFRRLNGSTLDGSFRLTGSYALVDGGPVRLEGDLESISLPELIALGGQSPSQPIEGQGSLRLDVRGTAGKSLLGSLTGTAALDVAEGALPQFNIVRQLFDRVSGAPGLAALVSAQAKPKYRRLFEAEDTRFEKIQATFRLAGGRAETDDLTVTAEEFGLRATGWLNLDQDIDISGTLAMSKRFSDDVVADLKEARYVVDDSGQLAIPFQLRGRLGQAKPKPDSAFLTRLVERAIAGGAAGNVLDKLLGEERRDDATPGKERPEKALERGLRELLGR